ncbi:MAG TPA: DUF1996 domain-containing protein [Patescibacteria group bacterium]|nr:DUF1996 domain-containing protein [Patescibacteria group bacterium]
MAAKKSSRRQSSASTKNQSTTTQSVRLFVSRRSSLLVSISVGIALMLAGLHLFSSYAATNNSNDRAHAVKAGGPGELGGFFVVQCLYDHASQDDPIVFPGQATHVPTHLHDFFGAKGINFNSTPQSLLNSSTTCKNKADTGGYWTPASMMGGTTITSKYQNEYWFDGGFSKMETIPQGMEIVAGNPHAVGPQPINQVFYYCGTGSPHRDKPYTCQHGIGSGKIIMVIVFPQCWNGLQASHNNISNMAYPTSPGHCPAGFDHVLPRLEEHVHVGLATPDNSNHNFAFSLSSGAYYTLHGDFINSWQPKELQKFITNCMNVHKNCGSTPRPNQSSKSSSSINPADTSTAGDPVDTSKTSESENN